MTFEIDKEEEAAAELRCGAFGQVSAENDFRAHAGEAGRQNRGPIITAMPGMPAEASFVVDWDGGLEWFCTFNCGPQHGSMSGMIVSTERK